MIQLAASPTTSTMRHVHNIHSFMCYLIYLFVLSSPHNGNYGFIALLSVTDQDTGLLTVPCRDHWIKSRFGLAISGLPPVHPAVTTGSQRRLGVVLATSPHCVSWLWKQLCPKSISFMDPSGPGWNLNFLTHCCMKWMFTRFASRKARSSRRLVSSTRLNNLFQRSRMLDSRLRT